MANLPPSSGTKGLNSGGITGIIFTVIHSGLFSVCACPSLIDSTTCNLLRASVFRCWEVSLAALSLKENASSSRFKLAKRIWRASAPILATNFFGSSSLKYWFSIGWLSRIFKYSSSVKKSKYLTCSPSEFKAFSPGLTTTKRS